MFSTKDMQHSCGELHSMNEFDDAMKREDARCAINSKLSQQITKVSSKLQKPTWFKHDTTSSVSDETDNRYKSGTMLASSQHLPVHLVTINKSHLDKSHFTFYEEPVYRQIVCNGNVEFRQDIAILIEPVSSQALSWFLPGDELIAVNDRSVVSVSKAEAWKTMLRCEEATIQLSVRPLAELSELRAKYLSDQVAQRQHKLPQDGEKEEDDSVWLAHKTGFTSAVRLHDSNLSPLPAGYSHLKLSGSGLYVRAKRSDIHEMNAVEYDIVDDLAQLPRVNESSVLHTLQQRFYSNLIHTFAGKKTLIVVNPRLPLCLYTDRIMRVMQSRHLSDLPPHIYTVAASAYESLRTTGQNQSVVAVGNSGSGKTTSVCHLLDYFCVATAAQRELRELMSAAVTVLEAFCNCRTILNGNASRVTSLFQLQYDACTRKLVGVSVQTLLMDDMRFAHRPHAESTYHVFYQFLAGIESPLRKEMLLENLNEPNLFVTGLRETADRNEAVRAWARTVHAMNTLRFSDTEQSAVCAVLSAIYHLGSAGSTRRANGYEFARRKAAVKAASVLGLSMDVLSQCVFTDNMQSISAMDKLESFVSALFSQLLQSVTYLINRTLSVSSSEHHHHPCITVVDVPGFQNPAMSGRHESATFTNLCHNYIAERLNNLFYHSAFTHITRLYMKENIPCDLTDLNADDESTPNIADMFDSVCHNKSGSRCGLFNLLNMIATQQQSDDDNHVVTSITQQFTDGRVRRVESETSRGSLLLEVAHLNQTQTVCYKANGWTRDIRRSSALLQLETLMSSSTRSNVRELMSRTVDDNSRHLLGCRQLHSTVDSLLESLQNCNIRFIHCLLSRDVSSTVNHSSLNLPLLRSQLRGSRLISSLCLLAQTCSQHFHLDEFLREFQILQPRHERSQADSKKKAVKQLLDYAEVNSADYQFGLTQVFIRYPAYVRLDKLRKNKLCDWVSYIQAYLRGFLSRSRAARQKFSDETDAGRKNHKLQAELARLAQLSRDDKSKRDELFRDKLQLDEENFSAQLQLKAAKDSLEEECDRTRKLQDEMEEMLNCSKKTLSEMNELKRHNADLERRCQQTEQQLAEQTNLVDDLQQTKQRLHTMQERNSQLKVKDHEEREKEIEDIRISFQKKMRGMEEQLEEEMSEKQKLLKNKRDLEKQLEEKLSERPSQSQEALHRVKVKLKKAKLLVADVQQSASQQQKVTADARRQSRQAHNDMEDLQTSVAAAVRSKNCLESEVSHLQTELQMSTTTQQQTEERCKQLAVDNMELSSKVTERDDEIDELMRKYKALVQKNSMDLSVVDDQSRIIQDLQCRVQKQKSDYETSQMRLRFLQDSSVPKETVAELEVKLRELEARMSFEAANRIRAEKLAEQLQSRVERAAEEQRRKSDVTTEMEKEMKMQRKQVGDLQREMRAARESDVALTLRSQQLEKKLRLKEVECTELSEELELSQRRITELESCLAATTSLNNSDIESDSSDE